MFALEDIPIYWTSSFCSVYSIPSEPICTPLIRLFHGSTELSAQLLSQHGSQGCTATMASRPRAHAAQGCVTELWLPPYTPCGTCEAAAKGQYTQTGTHVPCLQKHPGHLFLCRSTSFLRRNQGDIAQSRVPSAHCFPKARFPPPLDIEQSCVCPQSKGKLVHWHWCHHVKFSWVTCTVSICRAAVGLVFQRIPILLMWNR